MKTHFYSVGVRSPSQSGFTIPVAVVLTSVLALMVSALLAYAINSKKLNQRTRLWIEAKNASEAITEYGFADLAKRLKSRISFPVDELKQGKNPLTLPISSNTFFNGSSIDVTSLEIRGGPITPGIVRYIDPNDAINTFDPMKGKRARVINIDIYGKATASSTGLLSATYTAYTMERLQVRDTALFSHAIFYNMDLDFHPGPAMTMQGPVHSNGNIWMQAVSTLDFTESVTSGGKIYYGWKPSANYDANGNLVSYSRTMGGTVFVKNGPTGAQTSWPSDRDSTFSTWESYASNRWSGNVLSDVHGVKKLSAVSIPDYIEDKSWTVGTNERRNYGYSLIEPQLGTSTTYDKDSKGVTGEAQKISAAAGLIVRVKNSGNVPNAIELAYYDTVDGSTAVSQGNPAKRDSTTGVPREKSIVQFTVADLAAIQAKVSAGTALTATENAIRSISNAIKIEQFGYRTTGTTTDLTGGIWDAREGDIDEKRGRKHLVRVDVGELRKLVDDNLGSTYNNNKTDVWGALSGGYDPNKNFSGVIYVETPLAVSRGSTSHTSRPDNIRTAQGYDSTASIFPTAVLVENAQHVPDPLYNQNKSDRDRGFTLATNAPVYVRGHYNSDGNTTTGSAIAADSKAAPNAETPAAIMADAVTILSPGYNTATSRTAQISGAPTPSASTEVSAAIVTGLIPSIPGSGNMVSGGAHNLPRFLEAWGGTLLYRGSLVALYESEINSAPFNESRHSNWYSPPTRVWGFHNFFKNGMFPPGTPYVRDFRRIDFRDLTKAEYDAGVAALF